MRGDEMALNSITEFEDRAHKPTSKPEKPL